MHTFSCLLKSARISLVAQLLQRIIRRFGRHSGYISQQRFRDTLMCLVGSGEVHLVLTWNLISVYQLHPVLVGILVTDRWMVTFTICDLLPRAPQKSGVKRKAEPVAEVPAWLKPIPAANKRVRLSDACDQSRHRCLEGRSSTGQTRQAFKSSAAC